MARYIDAEVALNELHIASEKEGVKADDMAVRGVDDACIKYSHGQYCYINAQEIIKTIPTADVVEVKHGEWKRIIRNGKPRGLKCSLCGKHIHFHENYCPNCGAKMDGGKAE